jgi:replication factor C subunit 1
LIVRGCFLQGERNFNRFGGWFGKNSTQGKNRRLLEELRVHMLYSKCAEPTR